MQSLWSRNKKLFDSWVLWGSCTQWWQPWHISWSNIPMQTKFSLLKWPIPDLIFFYTSLVLTRRICLTIKSFFSKGSFPLFSWTSGLIQEWYCQKKLEGTDTVVTAIEGERKLEIILHFYGKMLNPRFFMTKKQILRKDTIHKEMWKRLKGYCKSNLIEQKCLIAFYWLYMWSFFF